MNNDEVLDRINKLDVLYKELDVLDEQLNSKEIAEIDFLIQENDIKTKIDKIFN